MNKQQICLKCNNKLGNWKINICDNCLMNLDTNQCVKCRTISEIGKGFNYKNKHYCSWCFCVDIGLYE